MADTKTIGKREMRSTLPAGWITRNSDPALFASAGVSPEAFGQPYNAQQAAYRSMQSTAAGDDPQGRGAPSAYMYGPGSILNHEATGAVDVAYNPQTQTWQGIDANGALIPGTDHTYRTNDDAAFIAGSLAIGGIGAYAAGTGVGAAGAAEATGGAGAAGGTGLTATEGAALDAALTGGTGSTAGAAGGAAGASGAAGATGAAGAAGAGSPAASGLSVSDWLGIGSVAAGMASSPEAPDTSGINAAAQSAAARDNDIWTWFKTEYEKTAGDRAAATARDNKIADASLEAMNFATQEAKDAAARRKTVFEPVEDRLVTSAQNYDTPARRAEEIARATADVESAAGRAQADNRRAMARMGYSAGADPAAAAALTQDAALQKAKMIAGASSGAVRNVEQQGYARMMDAAALGKGVVSNQATQQQLATAAGGAGVQAGAGSVAAGQGAVPFIQGAASGSNQALATAGNLYGQAAQIGATTRGQDLGFLNNAFSAYMMKSSKKVKKNTGQKADGKAELAEIEATPVAKDWKYDPAKGGPNDGGVPHTGPMAEDVQATMGDKVAPEGEVIDMREMGGKMLAGMQALSTQVKQLERKVARMSKSTSTTEKA